MKLKHVFLVVLLITGSSLTLTKPAWGAVTVLKSGLDIQGLKELTVSNVKIENFAGTVIVQPSEGIKNYSDKTVQVFLKGSEDLLEQIKVTEQHGELYISFEKEAPVIKDTSSIILTLRMPAKMPLELGLAGGKAEISAREAEKTKLTIDGFGDIKVASVKNLESAINGSGEITISNIKGDATIAIRGDGKYTLGEGAINKLKAQIQGTGEIIIEAKVKDAVLDSEGAGDIKLKAVTGALSQTIKGTGSIHIARG